MNNKFIEFGFFGPGVTYHTNKYDKQRIVISLIFCKIYITLPFKSHCNKFETYSVYGFYFDNDPDKLIICWKNYRKVITMPWVNIIIQRYLLDKTGYGHGDGNLTIDDCKKIVDNNTENFYRQSNDKYMPTVYYYVMQLYSKPKVFKKCKFVKYKESYEIVIVFDKSYYGYNSITFNTNTIVAVDEQILVQLLAIQMLDDKNYKDF